LILRILVATDQWFPAFTGGAARFAAEQAAQLAAAGHEVHVLAPEGMDLPHPLQRAGSIKRLGLPSTFADPVATFVAARAARGTRFDVVLAHQVTTAYGSTRALAGTPLVFVFHASAAREAQLRGTGGSKREQLKTAVLRRVLAWLERRVAASAAAIVPLSEYSNRLLAEDHATAGGRIERLSGAVDTSFFCPEEPDLLDPQPSLLVVRRLEDGLGVEQALEAVAELTAEGPLAVNLAGDGPAAARLKAHAHDLGLGETVKFLGNVPSSELVAWYRRSHAVLIPPAPHEGFGLAALEALACARPAVGHGGALSTLLGDLDESLVAKNGSPAALATAVRQALGLAGDPAFRDRCRAYAVENFSWSSVVPRWNALLEQVAGPSG
jgi:glycosyltransferase involved in cell wall biosynthesis